MIKKDWQFIIVFSLILIFLTNLPYLYGFLSAPSGQNFAGFGMYNWADNSVYYNYIEQVKEGHWLFRDYYTNEPQKPFFNIFWLILGLLAKIFNLSAPLIFHLARIFLTPLLVCAVYLFLKPLAEGGEWRKWLVFLFLVSGLGILFNNFPFPYNYLWDFSTPEGVIFFSIYATPHFIASWLLIILCFFFLIKHAQTRRSRDLIFAGATGLLLVQFHPFYAALLLTVPTIFYLTLSISEKTIKYLKSWLTFALFLLPVIIYYFYLRSDRVFFIRSKALMPSPPPVTLLMSFGLLLILAIIGLGIIFRKYPKQKAWLFIAVWFLVVPFLLYSPLAFQRRLIEGWLIPLALLALLGLKALGRKFFENDARFLFAAVLLLSSISTVVIWGNSFLIYGAKSPPLYFSSAAASAFQWIKKSTPADSIFLTNNFYYANLLPAFAVRQVYLGHGFETINIQRKNELTKWFFTSADEEKQSDFLKSNRLNYLFWDAAAAPDDYWQPDDKKFLEPIHQENNIRIYKVL